MLIFTDHGGTCRVSFTSGLGWTSADITSARYAREVAQHAEGLRDQLVEWAQRHERKPDPIVAAIEAAFQPDPDDDCELEILSRVRDDSRAARMDDQAVMLRTGIALGVYRAGKAVGK